MTAETANPRTGLTERQEKWFASLRAGLERETGKSVEDWAEIAKNCPETKPRARLKWLKSVHGVGQNRGVLIFDAAFPEDRAGWNDSDALLDALWKDDAARNIYDRLAKAALSLDGVTLGARKGFTGFSRKFQFAAARPLRDGVRIGLAVTPDENEQLEPAKPNEGWSERLKSSLTVMAPDQIDNDLKSLVEHAWSAS